MVANSNLNVLPFYPSKYYWHSKRWYTYGQVCPVMSKAAESIPFQFVITQGLTVQSVSICDMNDLVVRTLQASIIEADGYSVLVAKNQAVSALPLGQYYYKVALSDGSSLVSDVVCVIQNEADYIKLEYWNDENLYYTGGHVDYSNDFHFIAYIPSTIGKPDYEFQEEITERLGYKFIDSQISNKVYNFVFPANEAMCDALRLVRMSDYIKIQSSLDSYNALYFSYEVKWDDNGDIATVTASFETDTIIQKLESFNRRQTEDFYNALLANINEPIKFDTDVVAQYYKDFMSSSSGTIEGKLIRELDETLNLPDSAEIPVDLGTGEAKKATIATLAKTVSDSIAGNFVSNETLTKLLDLKLDKSVFDDLFEKVVEDGVTFIKAKYNFYSVGEVAAGGAGSGSGGSTGGGIDEAQLWSILGNTGTEQISKTHLTTALAGYATETWVSGQGYATQSWVAAQGYITNAALDGYATVTEVDNRINDLINGAPAAYDTLKEIADVLQGNVDSIGDIITTLGTKADKAISISAGTGLTGGGDLTANRTLSLATVGTAGTYTKITVDAYGRVTGHSSLVAADIPTLSISKISDLQTALDNKLDESVFNDLFEKVVQDGQTFIKAKYNFYSLGEVAAGGAGSGSGGSTGGGIDEAQLWSILGNTGTEQISKTHLTTALSGYATETWVEGKGYATQSWVTAKGYITADALSGYATEEWVEDKGYLTSYTNNYLTSVSGNGNSTVTFARQGLTSLTWNAYHTHTFASLTSKPTTLAGYGITDGVNAVSVTGSGNAVTAASVSGHTLTLTKGSTFLLSSAYTAADILEKLKTVDGSGSGLDADTLDGLQSTAFARATSLSFGGELIEITTAEFITYLEELGVFNYKYWVGKGTWTYAANYIITDSGYGNIQLAGAVVEVFSQSKTAYIIRITTSPAATNSGIANAVFVYRNHGDNYNPNWKRIANTTDNVASATKLQTPRTLWGQSFDGTANISGNMAYVGRITFNSNDIYLTDPDGNNILTRQSKNLFVQSNAGGYLAIGYRGTSYIDFYGGVTTASTAGTTLGRWNTTGLGVGTASPSYKLHVAGTIGATGLITATAGLTTPQYIQIGSGRIYWDATNNALYVKKSDGTAINFYSLGEISAGGASAGSGSTGGGIDEEQLWSILGNTGTEQIAKNHLTSALAGYLTTVNLATITDLHSNWDAVLKVAPTSYVTRWPSFAEVTAKPTTLSGYGITDGVNTVSTSGSGNAITSASISGHTLTLTKGSTFSLSSHTHSYLPKQDTRSVEYAPYDSDFTSKGLSATHLKYNTTDGLSDGGTYHTSLYLYPWNDKSGGAAHNLAFTDNGNMWIRSGTTSWNAWKKVLTTGNYTPILDTRYVKKSGDTMTGSLKLETNSLTRNIVYSDSGTDNMIFGDVNGSTGVRGSNIFFQNSVGSSIFQINGNIGKFTNTPLVGTNKIWHEGNDGSNSGLDADLLDGVHKTDFVKKGTRIGAIDWNTLKESYLYDTWYDAWGTNTPTDVYKYGQLLILKGYTSVVQMYIPHSNTEGIRLRITWDGTDAQWGNWKRLALTTDNVASATKLLTPRTLWGKSFDGTANVSGALSYVTEINANAGAHMYIDSASGYNIGIRYNGSDSNGITITQTELRRLANAASYNLGSSTYRWANVYSILGNFSGLITATAGLTTPQYIQIGSGRIYWDATNNALYVKKSDGTAINFYSLGEIAAGGAGTGSGGAGGGIDEEQLWSILGNTGTEQIAKNHLTSALAGYLTTVSLSTITDLHSNWDSVLKVAPTSYVTRWPTFAEVTGKPTTLSGYGITDAVTIGTTQTITGTKTFNADAYIASDKYIRIVTDSLAVFGYNSANTALYVGNPNRKTWIRSNSDLIHVTNVASYTILDTGNYTTTLDTRYVKKSGDIMTGSLSIPIGASGLCFGTNTTYEGGRLLASSDGRMYLQAGTEGKLSITGRNTVNLVDLSIKADSATINGNEIWHAGNDGSGSGLDADLLDGVHNGNLTSKYFNYSSSAIWDCNNPTATLHSDYGSANREILNTPDGWNYGQLFTISRLNSFANSLAAQFIWDVQHNTKNPGRLWFRTKDSVNSWDRDWGKIAFVTDNVASATKLQTARTIWGQSFDGTANVSGSISGVSTITMSSNLRSYSENGGFALYSGSTTNTALRIDSVSNNGTWLRNCLTLYHNGNFGIDTISPAYKLHVVGTMYASGAATFGSTLTAIGAIHGSSIYADTGYFYTQTGWFQNNKAGTGLYNSAEDARWYASSGVWRADKAITSSGTITGTNLIASNGKLQSTANTKTITIYSENSSWCHYRTTATNGHWFGNNVTIQGNLESYGGTKNLGASDARWNLYAGTGNFSGAVALSSTLSVASTSTFTGKTTHNGGIACANEMTLSSDFRLNGSSAQKIYKYYSESNWSQLQFLQSNASNGGFTDILLNIQSSNTIQFECGGNFIWFSKGNIAAKGEVAAGSSSDKRLKNILQVADYQKRLLALGNVVDYEYNDIAFQRKARTTEHRRYTGLIYQNVINVLPQMAGKDDDGYGYLNYIHTDYINLIAGALQQTIRKQETIEQRVARLEKENEELKRKIAKLAA